MSQKQNGPQVGVPGAFHAKALLGWRIRAAFDEFCFGREKTQIQGVLNFFLFNDATCRSLSLQPTELDVHPCDFSGRVYEQMLFSPVHQLIEMPARGDFLNVFP
jgi:hypothetical protein